MQNNIYRVSKKDLKNMFIEDYKDRDMIIVDNKYTIRVMRGGYPHPSLMTQVSDYNTMKPLSATAGVRGGRPYFIDNFISKRKA